jgi:hypothetical protein
MLDTLTLETFQPLLGAPFAVIVDDERFMPAQLVAAEPLAGDSDSRRKRQPFTLIFRGPAGGHLPQNTYRVRGGELEEMELFLVPIGPDEHGVLYEAVFT